MDRGIHYHTLYLHYHSRTNLIIEGNNLVELE